MTPVQEDPQTVNRPDLTTSDQDDWTDEDERRARLREGRSEHPMNQSDPTREALTPEAERTLRRDIERGGPVTPGDVILLLNTLDAARSAALPSTPAPLDVERLTPLINGALDAYPPDADRITGWSGKLGRKAAPRALAAHVLAALSSEPSVPVETP